MIARTKISHIIIIGDSLSDRGTMYKKLLFGCIPMSSVSGLKGKSPGDSFTNGFPWSDHLIATIANEFTIQQFQSQAGLDATDIADAIITHDNKITSHLNSYYHLKNDREASYKGSQFVRTYTEGGLTSHDYSWMPSKSPKRFFSRLILDNLDNKREKLISYDKVHALSDKDKEKTLIIEWSGANDMITVNERPTKQEADDAIKDRIKNVKELINHGYKHFILFNLPDLSFTPRYKAKSEWEQKNAHLCCDYFNTKLSSECDKLNLKYPGCAIEVMDVNQELIDINNDPVKYGFDPDKMHQTYIDSPDFKLLETGTSPSTGFVFWDDVHPTADVHALIAYRFREKYHHKYEFIPYTNDKKMTKEIKKLRLSVINRYGLFVNGTNDSVFIQAVEEDTNKNNEPVKLLHKKK